MRRLIFHSTVQVVAAALCLPVTAHSAPATPATTRAWASGHVQPLGWTASLYTPAFALYLKPAPRAGLFKPPRVWSRLEYPEAASRYIRPVYSVVGLAEVDCGRGRLREVRQLHYAANNMAGDLVYEDDLAGAWREAPPGGVEAVLVRYACERR